MTNLEAFTISYIETALWASNDESDESGGDPIDSNYGPDDLDLEALKVMQEDCRKFVEACRESIIADKDNGFGDAGHDFWLTRNGHGVGFWDGDWSEPYATLLDEASEAFGDCHLYVENDTIYID